MSLVCRLFGHWWREDRTGRAYERCVWCKRTTGWN